MLSAKVVPPVGADTEYADMRAAYDALPDEIKTEIEGLRVHHSIAYSRQTLGFEFSKDEEDALKGAVHPLVRTIPRSAAALALRGLARLADRRLARSRGAAAAPRPHRARDPAAVRLPPRWRVGDLVIWDNRATMHRARPFEDTKHRRELRRVTTLDID